MEDLQVHVVTGASSGVGLALVSLLSERGHNVLALARREHELQTLQQSNPDRISILSVDISKDSDRQRVADWVVRGNHAVVSLTHSAAITSKGYLQDLKLETYRELMSINVEGPLFLTQVLVPHFKRGARVLHLSSGAAHRAMPYNGLYCISKSALLMSYRAWNADCSAGDKPRDFVVGSAMPGVVDGPMQDAARQGEYPGVELYRSMKEKHILIKPGKVADFLAWLLFDTSDEEFTSQDWNIFDTVHHPKWLTGELNSSVNRESL